MDVDKGAREHADLGNPVKGAQGHGGQPHDQIDHEEGDGRNQAQGEEVERAFALDAVVHLGRGLREAAPHPVAQKEPGQQAGQGGARGTGEGDEDRAGHGSEHGPGQESENGCTGEVQDDDQQVGGQEGGHDLQRGCMVELLEPGLRGFDGLEGQVFMQAQSEKSPTASRMAAPRAASFQSLITQLRCPWPIASSSSSLQS